MPPARSASASASPEPRRQPRATPRRPPRAKPHKVALRSPKLRVRWERVGRYGLVVVLMIVVGLYVEHTLSYFSTRTQSDQQQAIVSQLTRQNRGLAQQLKSLNDPATIVRDARALGMVRPGERAYAMTGQSAH
jgi:cell division protein FtsB